jgi:hypothetical protein
MKRPAEYYTLWNQAVEAVEIYLARNPRELTEERLQVLFSSTYLMLDGRTQLGKDIDPAGMIEQEIVKHNLIHYALRW